MDTDAVAGALGVEMSPDAAPAAKRPKASDDASPTPGPGPAGESAVERTAARRRQTEARRQQNEGRRKNHEEAELTSATAAVGPLSDEQSSFIKRRVAVEQTQELAFIGYFND